MVTMIDEAISHLSTYSSTMGSGQTTQAQHEESKEIAITIMRRYQKIEQIMNQAQAPWETIQDTWLYKEIIGVLEWDCR